MDGEGEEGTLSLPHSFKRLEPIKSSTRVQIISPVGLLGRALVSVEYCSFDKSLTNGGFAVYLCILWYI